MTPAELNDTLDAMADAAAGNPDMAPGLVTVETNAWIETLWELRPTCSAISDGLRHREIKVVISSAFETKVLTRAEAGERGAPYRDLTPPGRATVADCA